MVTLKVSRGQHVVSAQEIIDSINQSDIGIQSGVLFDAITDASVPTPAATLRAVYHSSTQSAMVAKDDAGVVHNLESAGGSQTPWTSDIDADNFSLLDLNLIEITGSSGDIIAGKIYESGASFRIEAPIALDVLKLRTHDGTSVVDVLSISSAANTKTLTFGDVAGVDFVSFNILEISNAFNINAPTGYSQEFQINGVSEFAITAAIIFANQNEMALLGNISFGTGVAVASGEVGIYPDGSNMILNVPAGQGYSFQIGLGEAIGINSDGTLDMSNESIINLNDIDFTNAGNEFNTSSGGLTLRVLSGGSFTFQHITTTVLQMDTTGIELVNGKTIRATAAGNCGYFIDDSTSAIGSVGTNQLPYIASTDDSPSTATLNGWFGSENGCAGFQFDNNTPDVYTFWAKLNSVWRRVTI